MYIFAQNYKNISETLEHYLN